MSNFIVFPPTQRLHEHVIRRLSVLLSPKWRVFTVRYDLSGRYSLSWPGGKSLQCHVVRLDSISCQSVWDLWPTKWHLHRILSFYFGFPLYHSTIAARSSIHLPPTLYNVFLPALQFSPVSTIPPLLHTHPSIYHPHCIMFFSQHFSFPLSVSFHHCSTLIHPSTTHTV